MCGEGSLTFGCGVLNILYSTLLVTLWAHFVVLHMYVLYSIVKRYPVMSWWLDRRWLWHHSQMSVCSLFVLKIVIARISTPFKEEASGAVNRLCQHFDVMLMNHEIIGTRFSEKNLAAKCTSVLVFSPPTHGTVKMYYECMLIIQCCAQAGAHRFFKQFFFSLLSFMPGTLYSRFRVIDLLG